MPSTESTISEADILSQVVGPDQPGLGPDAARYILELRFGDDAQKRMRELMNKNNKGTITEVERADMEKYLRVGKFLDLIQAKARVSLKQSASSE